MAKLKHYNVDGQCYFITTTTVDKRQLFNKQENAEILCNIIYNLRRKKKLSLLGFTIMPEHLHLIIIPQNGVTVSWLLQEIKKGSSRLINMKNNTKGKIWMDEFYDYIIRDEGDLIKHLNYVYNNAVKRRLAEVSSMYAWCSANPKFETDLQKVLSGSGTTPTTNINHKDSPEHLGRRTHP